MSFEGKQHNGELGLTPQTRELLKGREERLRMLEPSPPKVEYRSRARAALAVVPYLRTKPMKEKITTEEEREMRKAAVTNLLEWRKAKRERRKAKGT